MLPGMGFVCILYEQKTIFAQVRCLGKGVCKNLPFFMASSLPLCLLPVYQQLSDLSIAKPPTIGYFRKTKTGHRANRITLSATDPNKKRRSPVRP